MIIDTNVAVIANNRAQSPQASEDCVINCVRRLQEIKASGTIVLDDAWRILQEYERNLHSGGEPGVGYAFLKWVHDNLRNPERCQQVPITPDEDDDENFIEFPSDPMLAHFDRADRKFVAVARAHQQHPPILTAIDTDWWEYRQALSNNGVKLDFLCEAEVRQLHQQKVGHRQ